MNRKYVVAILMLIIGSIIGSVTVSAEKVNSITLLNQDPDPAITGDIVEIRIGVENTGDETYEDLMIELVPEYPFELVPGEDAVYEIGNLAPNLAGDNIKIIRYKIKVDKDAIAGTYDLYVMDYEGTNTDPDIKRPLEINVKSQESSQTISIDPLTLNPGEVGELRFKIDNVGTAPLRDITLSWSNEEDIILPISSDNSKYIKYVEVGSTSEILFDVIADSEADPGLYKIDITLTYDDSISGEEEQITSSAGVYIGGETDFDITYSESSGSDYAFSIANIGSNSASSVSVSIPTQQGWEAQGANSMMIGNLNKGDYTVASFTLSSNAMGSIPNIDEDGARGNGFPGSGSDDAESDSEGMAPMRQNVSTPTVQIQVDYTDTKGERKSIIKEVVINTNSATTGVDMEEMMASRGRQQNSNNNALIYGGIALVGVAGFFIYKKKKGKNK